MYLFQCKDKSGAQAKIRVSSVDWALPGAVAFECTHDELACRLLTRCRSDSSGYFNLLAGCKPLQVEQWLEYLLEKGYLATPKTHSNFLDSLQFSAT